MLPDMNQKKETHTYNEKLSAAYALNMCTVSVSQIVDYHDLFVLEQEYEAILNNLNLKNMPKDQALLDTLTEILNTITFFRIKELKKDQIEKEYQLRMKNAIWSAVPNFNVFISGNPISMMFSLATTVGTSYMNYRREKINALKDKDDAEIELQITAIEQLNALKRELFTTAWRLADEYDFEDKWRLTENQIKQYNKILMDCDEYRKYARLEAIQENFMAYPPFWYYLGHIANYISETEADPYIKKEYKEKAKLHFSQYENANTMPLLREDKICAAFALEYCDLLLSENHRNVDKIKQLIQIAQKNAGNNFDILQLCAISYLKVGSFDNAAKLLKILVNEDYNKITNARLLSGIYVKESRIPDYKILMKRVSHKYLFPMPQIQHVSALSIYDSFEAQQKNNLRKMLHAVLQEIINKYTALFNQKVTPIYDENTLPESYYENTSSSKERRISDVKRLMKDYKGEQHYQEQLFGLDLSQYYIQTLEEIFKKLFSINCFKDENMQREVLYEAYLSIEENQAIINSIQSNILNHQFSYKDYEELQNIGIKSFVERSFMRIDSYIKLNIDDFDMKQILSFEGDLTGVCLSLGIKVPELPINDDNFDMVKSPAANKNYFNAEMFGVASVVAKRQTDFIDELVDYLKEKCGDLCVRSTSIAVLFKGDPEFSRYFSDSIYKKYSNLASRSLMIINDNGPMNHSLIYTTDGIVSVIKHKVYKEIPYNKVRLEKGVLKLNSIDYRNESIDNGLLYHLAAQLDKKHINKLDDKIEYVGGVLNAKRANQWFKDNSNYMTGEVGGVYAWPTKKVLSELGYDVNVEYDKDKFLLQIYYEKESQFILKARLIEYEDMDVNFKSLLNEQKGVLTVEL